MNSQVSCCALLETEIEYYRGHSTLAYLTTLIACEELLMELQDDSPAGLIQAYSRVVDKHYELELKLEEDLWTAHRLHTLQEIMCRMLTLLDEPLARQFKASCILSR